MGIENWEEFGEYVLEKTLNAIDDWAWNISGGSALEAYLSYENLDLYEAAETFDNKISNEELELLRKMPNKLYETLNQKYHEELERIISDLEKEQREYCLNECEYRETEKCKACEFHYLIE
jgi:Mg/Co/Ni transporter MgtE